MARDKVLERILVSPDYHRWGIGNSLQDLRLSVKGYRFGRETQVPTRGEGIIQSLNDAASWLRVNLTYALVIR